MNNSSLTLSGFIASGGNGAHIISIPAGQDTMGRVNPTYVPRNTCPDCGRVCSNRRGVRQHQRRFCKGKVTP